MSRPPPNRDSSSRQRAGYKIRSGCWAGSALDRLLSQVTDRVGGTQKRSAGSLKSATSSIPRISAADSIATETSTGGSPGTPGGSARSMVLLSGDADQLAGCCGDQGLENTSSTNAAYTHPEKVRI